MRVLEDFAEDEAEELRKLEGILKKDEERTIVIEDGAIKSFGKDQSCDYYIPLEDLDYK